MSISLPGVRGGPSAAAGGGRVPLGLSVFAWGAGWRRHGMPLLLGCILAFGCTGGDDLEADIPSREGAHSPAGGGRGLSEDEACEALREAVQAKVDGLDCEREIPRCPEFIRPAGSLACAKYSSESVEDCRETIEGYRRCDDFDEHPCIVVALEERTEGCVLPGTIDAGGDAAADGGEGEPDDAGRGEAGLRDSGDAPPDAAETPADSGVPDDSGRVGDAAPESG